VKDLLEIVWSFIKIGTFTFGGGYAMLPLIQREVVDKKHWATMPEIMDYYSIGQCMPGIIAVNTAAFVGYKRKTALGAIAGVFGVVLPSFIIISVIAAGLENFSNIATVQHAFAGIRVAVGALILDAVIKLFKGSVKNIPSLVICFSAFLLSALFNTSPVWIVLSAALAGLFLFSPRKRKSE